MAIDIVNRQRLVSIDPRRVANLADAALSAAGRAEANVTVAFVRDRVIRELNRKFRGNDRATDVLSFPTADERTTAGAALLTDAAAEFLGDIVVSTDAALRQANDAGCSLVREVDELVIHGVLHLCGYDHETDRGQMNRLELKLRRKLLGE